MTSLLAMVGFCTSPDHMHVIQATRSKIFENDENHRSKLKQLKTIGHRSENVENI